MFLKSILSKAAPDRGGLSATQQALEAQTALLPYALGGLCHQPARLCLGR